MVESPETQQVIGIFNPLPGVLAHFERAIVDNVERSGARSVVLDAPSIELAADEGAMERVRAVMKIATAALKSARRRDVEKIVVLWPTFGYLDMVVWQLVMPRMPVHVILHDVQPLRPQFGYSPRLHPLSNRISRSGRVSWVLHTDAAADEFASLGFDRASTVPHPVLPEPTAPVASDVDVLVFGQFKPARDLGLLEALGTELASAGKVAKIVGRGWPDVSGWDVDSRFVDESDVPKLLAGGRVVLLPYSRYYQSGVALRALETGTAVVGRRTEFLESIFGADWCGLVDDDTPAAWVQAIAKAAAVPKDQIEEIRKMTYLHSIDGWQEYLSHKPKVLDTDRAVAGNFSVRRGH